MACMRRARRARRRRSASAPVRRAAGNDAGGCRAASECGGSFHPLGGGRAVGGCCAGRRCATGVRGGRRGWWHSVSADAIAAGDACSIASARARYAACRAGMQRRCATAGGGWAVAEFSASRRGRCRQLVPAPLARHSCLGCAGGAGDAICLPGAGTGSRGSVLGQRSDPSRWSRRMGRTFLRRYAVAGTARRGGHRLSDQYLSRAAHTGAVRDGDLGAGGRCARCNAFTSGVRRNCSVPDGMWRAGGAGRTVGGTRGSGATLLDYDAGLPLA